MFESQFIKVEACLSAVIKWYSENGLSANPSKTEATLIGTIQRLSIIERDYISVGCTMISISRNASKKLSVLFDP